MRAARSSTRSIATRLNRRWAGSVWTLQRAASRCTELISMERRSCRNGCAEPRYSGTLRTCLPAQLALRHAVPRIIGHVNSASSGACLGSANGVTGTYELSSSWVRIRCWHAGSRRCHLNIVVVALASTRNRPPRDGAPGRIRTCDHRLRRPMLYPLSYGRVFWDQGGWNGAPRLKYTARSPT
jgi:hypothetical protein